MGNPKSTPTYGHTFSQHGKKITKQQLIDIMDLKIHIKLDNGLIINKRQIFWLMQLKIAKVFLMSNCLLI